MRKITKTESGILCSSGGVVVCPIMSSLGAEVSCQDSCAFYGEVTEEYLEKHPDFPKYAYCNFNGDSKNREIVIGELERS